MIDSLSTLFYTMTFLLPGFIIFYTKSKVLPQRIVSNSDNIFRYFFYSGINMMISLPILYYINSENVFKEKPYIVIFLWITCVIIVPILLGVILAVISIKELDKKMISKICLTTLGNIPTSWDYKFSKLDVSSFMCIKLKDGSFIRGLYSFNSYSSSYLEERDIYLEKRYDIDDNGNWIIVNNSDGILIKASEIIAIEFITTSSEIENKIDDKLEY